MDTNKSDEDVKIEELLEQLPMDDSKTTANFLDDDELDLQEFIELDEVTDFEDLDEIEDFEDLDELAEDEDLDEPAEDEDLDGIEDEMKNNDEGEEYKFEMTEIDSQFDQKRFRFKKPLLLTLAGVAGVLLLAYIIGAVYFSSHFFINTEINDKDYSKQTVEQVQKEMESHVDGYVLNLKENTETTESISGADISLAYKQSDELEKAKKQQKALLWPKGFFVDTKIRATITVDYDKEALNQKIGALECTQEANQTPSANAYPAFNEGTASYDIVPEVHGTQINQEVFAKEVEKAISEFQTDLDMEKKNCYLKPKFLIDSPEVSAARDVMNTYVKSTVTYNVGETPEVVSGAKIASWITLGPNMEVTLNTEAINAYVAELSSKFSTVGSTRTIVTPGGKSAEVSGGTFGWKLDQEGELNTLIANVQSGTPITRDLIYAQTGGGHGANDWGNTYVEVDLTAQYMWYIVNGGVAFESAVVTGAPTPEKATPQGVYSILEKAPNSILKGEIQPDGKREYETLVSYWMRVTWSGIGFHDANWQPTFGGDRYMQPGGGSHGCINMPPSAAATFYGMLKVGDPVVMHY